MIAFSFGATRPIFKEMSKLRELQFCMYIHYYTTKPFIFIQIIYLFMVHTAILILAMAVVTSAQEVS